MFIACGWPPVRPRLDRPIGEGTLFVRVGEVVRGMQVPAFCIGIMMGEVRFDGQPLPPTAELWFESAREHWH
jgi:hypothetical protein